MPFYVALGLAAGVGPLFMLVRLCRTQEDARTALATISAVRAAEARLHGRLAPFVNQGKLAKEFAEVRFSGRSGQLAKEVAGVGPGDYPGQLT